VGAQDEATFRVIKETVVPVQDKHRALRAGFGTATCAHLERWVGDQHEPARSCTGFGPDFPASLSCSVSAQPNDAARRRHLYTATIVQRNQRSSRRQGFLQLYSFPLG